MVSSSPVHTPYENKNETQLMLMPLLGLKVIQNKGGFHPYSKVFALRKGVQGASIVAPGQH